MASGTYWNPGVAFFEQREMLTFLKCNEGPGVAGAAGSGKVAPIHRARGILAIKNAAVGQKRFESCGVTSVTLLASYIVAAMRGTVPIGEMGSGRGARIGEVTVSTSTLCNRRDAKREKRREAQADRNSKFFHRL